MTKKEMVRPAHHRIATGAVHEVPADLRQTLTSDGVALKAWEGITSRAQ